MPGYGFSGKPTTAGWAPDRIARAWAELIKRLGYTKYVAQDGDWGAIVTDLMGVQEPQGLIGIHTNMAGVVPPAIDKALQAGNPLPSDLSDDEKRACNQLKFVWDHVAYDLMMGSRPQTLTGLADSPVALAAFMIDHDAKSLELISRAFAGHAEGLTRDDVLDNITHFWLTNTGASASRLFSEDIKSGISFFGVKGVSIPVAMSVFPDELHEVPKSWSEQVYPNLIHYNQLDKGGHFAAWEQPQLFSEEVRARFRPLR